MKSFIFAIVAVLGMAVGAQACDTVATVVNPSVVYASQVQTVPTQLVTVGVVHPAVVSATSFQVVSQVVTPVVVQKVVTTQLAQQVHVPLVVVHHNFAIHGVVGRRLFR